MSHNLYAIEQLCTRVIWLDKGRIAQVGNPSEVLSVYMDEMDRDISQSRSSNIVSKQDVLKVKNFRLVDSMGQEREVFQTGENITVQIEYECMNKVERPYFVVWISESRNNLPLAAANMLVDNFEVKSKSTLLRTFLSGRNSNISLRAPFALSAATHSPPWLSHESLLFP